jgi:hypothetical protein
MCQQVAYEVNYLPADFQAIATQVLSGPRVYPEQRGIRAGFHCLTG